MRDVARITSIILERETPGALTPGAKINCLTKEANSILKGSSDLVSLVGFLRTKLHDVIVVALTCARLRYCVKTGVQRGRVCESIWYSRLP